MTEDSQTLKLSDFLEASDKPPVFNIKHLSELFENLLDFWRPVLVSFSLAQPHFSLELIDEISIDNKSYFGSFFVNSVAGRIEVDAKSAKNIAQPVSTRENALDTEIVIAYFFRRLIASLEKSWQGSHAISMSYSDKKIEDLNSLNYKIRLNVVFENKESSKVDFFISEHTLNLISKELEILNNDSSDISLEFSRFTISAEELIEYLKPGNVIELKQKIDNQCQLYLGSSLWAKAKIKTYNSKYILELIGFESVENQDLNTGTQVSIELNRFQLLGQLESYNKVGTLIPPNINVDSEMFLVVRGERIATVSLLQEGEKTKIKVLKKV